MNCARQARISVALRCGRGAEWMSSVGSLMESLYDALRTDYQMYDDRRTITVMQVETTLPDVAHPALDQIELASVLHALSDPIRLRIVAGLADGGEVSCGRFELPVTKSTCTHHFRVLREAGVISQRVQGTTRLTSCAGRSSRPAFPGSWMPCCAPAATDPARQSAGTVSISAPAPSASPRWPDPSARCSGG